MQNLEHLNGTPVIGPNCKRNDLEFLVIHQLIGVFDRRRFDLHSFVSQQNMRRPVDLVVVLDLVES